MVLKLGQNEKVKERKKRRKDRIFNQSRVIKAVAAKTIPFLNVEKIPKGKILFQRRGHRIADG